MEVQSGSNGHVTTTSLPIERASFEHKVLRSIPTFPHVDPGILHDTWYPIAERPKIENALGILKEQGLIAYDGYENIHVTVAGKEMLN